MNLKELKERIDFLVETLPNKDPENIRVKINVKSLEPTLGARPSTDVKSVRLGFDWEKNELRIEPEQPLYKGRIE